MINLTNSGNVISAIVSKVLIDLIDLDAVAKFLALTSGIQV